MKSFYAPAFAPAVDLPFQPGEASGPETGHSPLYIRTRARVAVYDAPAAAPRVEEIQAAPVGEYIEALASRVYELARSAGGSVPYTVVREVTENFIHAEFAEPVVSIMDSGSTVRFADQGPGIPDKERAVLPGFTTARGDLKRYIRGVGSGLPIVREYLSCSGGSLVIEDNLGSGSVVTVRTRSGLSADHEVRQPLGALDSSPPRMLDGGTARLGFDSVGGPTALLRLTTRQKQVLALVLESGSAGPSLVAKELGVGISTAYRDLASLEDLGLIEAEGGKRTLTTLGLSYLDDLTAR